MILEILQEEDPILREVSKPVESDFYLEELVDSMIETMKSADGVGLAAPQVGHSLRLFVVLDVDSLEHKNTTYDDCGVTVFVNPRIIRRSEQTLDFEESCLSIEGVTGVVTRPEKIMVKYQDTNLKERIDEFDGHMSRIIQHEYDHLEGKLFTDYLV